MKWASAVAQAAHLEDALDEALESVIEELDQESPDLLLVFASPDYSTHLTRLVPYLAEHAPESSLLGCSADGVIGGGREVEGERALSLIGAVLPGVELRGFHLDGNPESWRAAIGGEPDESPAFILLSDPMTAPTADLLHWMDVNYPASLKVGGVASGIYAPGSTALFVDSGLERGGAVGMAMHGNLSVETVVAQGCRPIGAPLFVTRAEKGIILELDSQPALAVLDALYTQLPTRDQELFRHSLFLGQVVDPARQEYGHGDFLIRNIVGIEPTSSAVAVAAELAENQVVQFHLRDAKTSAEDLEQMLGQCSDRPLSGALLFSCLGRGKGLYGHDNHDSDAFRARFGDIPLGGFFGNGEIGPIGPRTFLHGYTSAFALFRPLKAG